MIATESGLRYLAAKTAEIFLPPVCAACGSVGEIICRRCREQFVYVPADVCPDCGKSIAAGDVIHSACTGENTVLSQVFAPLGYTHPLSMIIHQMKYAGYFALAGPLADIMIEHWPVWDHTPDLIIPIPLHARRSRERGFNQSGLLAQRVGKLTATSVDETSLQRIRHTIPQVGLSPDERFRNVAGAFEAQSANVRARHIVLIDDVFTTGATTRSAAVALLDAGATTVAAYCLARTAS